MKNIIRILTLIPFLFIACQSTKVIIIPTPTINPTLTPLFPTKTATPLSQENTMHIELPDWIKDITTNILALAYADEPYTRPSKIKFVNPENGDIITVQLSRKYYYHYWRDKEHLVFLQEGYCNESPKFISEIDISKGILKEYDATNYPEKIQGCYDFFDSSEELVRINTEFGQFTIETQDSITGKFTLLTNPYDGIVDLSYKLSPKNDYVAIVQTSRDFETDGGWRPIYGNQISIYNLSNHELVFQSVEREDISTIISFLDNDKLVYMRENTPCLILISSLSKNCIHNIPQRFPDSNIILGKPLLDSGKFSFIYFSYEPHYGGYCQYDLFGGTIKCPTDGFESLVGQTIMSYSFSSNEKFLLIMYDSEGCPQPWCDEADEPKLALININESRIYELGNTDVSQFGQPVDLYYYPPWRP